MQASFFIQLGHPTTVTLESFLINGRQDARSCHPFFFGVVANSMGCCPNLKFSVPPFALRVFCAECLLKVYSPQKAQSARRSHRER
jgi:hypothetical protein